MKRGRPFRSSVRQNIIELLSVIGKAYGYQIHKIYLEVFPPCTRESIYYHLRTGVKLGELEVAEIKQEQGNYSWGGTVEKIYYVLGPKAEPSNDSRESGEMVCGEKETFITF